MILLLPYAFPYLYNYQQLLFFMNLLGADVDPDIYVGYLVVAQFLSGGAANTCLHLLTFFNFMLKYFFLLSLIYFAALTGYKYIDNI